jgi:hypothetical protein
MANPTKEKNALKATGVARTSFSIPEFCAMNDISVSMYGKMRRDGLNPREMRLGRRVLISKESAAAWRVEREENAQ